VTLTSGFFANAVLVVAAIILLLVAIENLRELKIRNAFIVALICLFALYVALAGEWREAWRNLMLAIVAFIILLPFYRPLGWFGGGLLKLLTVGFLWSGERYAISFIVLALIFCGLSYLLARLGLLRVHHQGEATYLAFGAPIAVALIAIFIMRWTGY